MLTVKFRRVVEQVARRAQVQGNVDPSEVREELLREGLSNALWKRVVAQSSPALEFRDGRYYPPAPVSARMLQIKSGQAAIRRDVRRLLRRNQAAEVGVERRGQGRRAFAQRVTVRTEDGLELTMLSRDLSNSGICLIGSRRLLGHKVRVSIVPSDAEEPFQFVVRILWTCNVGDDLYENGGPFLSVDEQALPDR